jgi:hypothetical protein
VFVFVFIFWFALIHFLAQLCVQISDFSIMFLTRFTGRTLLAAAKSETPAASAAAATATSGHNPLNDFFEFERGQDDDKLIVYGMI